MPMTDIRVYRPRTPQPSQFYTAIVTLLGVRNAAPPPHKVTGLTLTSDGDKARLVLDLADGDQAVAELQLDRRIDGLI